ncbi:class I SAM-dependent methyltransferase [Denitromonas ohlonensis]|uniref:Methyltransferase domain-containing protein n=2 Tax=Denitromonas TaxID=139331 RepID=A0A557SE87_9RHOO|nr:class I SAM-dependent methyltransferase [Denitromonas ohlonensis]TVO60274.1 methyltransferase domain-containing protein [Denitromonas ohlonensis]TVO75747.1 methyltransferase domain-containing protein [Denitromonas ohlonensis]
MRITYRNQDVKDYWERRWSEIPADEAMTNTSVYPLKYAQAAITDRDAPILEAGCGAGRILRYYHQLGYDITGIDYIQVAIDKLRDVDATLKVDTGNITALEFADAQFGYVLAFGLFHNLQDGLERAVEETYRVLRPGGRVCASFRADNIQTRLVDWLANRKSRQTGSSSGKAFHKMNLTKREFRALFERVGFMVDSIDPVENMPILYKFAFFRARHHKRFDENLARKEGYRLSPLGSLLQRFMMRYFPDQFCNIYVLIATKP